MQASREKVSEKKSFQRHTSCKESGHQGGKKKVEKKQGTKKSSRNQSVTAHGTETKHGKKTAR